MLAMAPSVVRFRVQRTGMDGTGGSEGAVDVQVGASLGRNDGTLFAATVSRTAVVVQGISADLSNSGGGEAHAVICARGVDIAPPGTTLLLRNFEKKLPGASVIIRVGTRIKLGVSIATVTFIGDVGEASLMPGAGDEDDDEDGDDDGMQATQAPRSDDEAQACAAGRAARFDAGTRSVVTVSEATQKRLNAPLGTKRGTKGRSGKRVGKAALRQSVAAWHNGASNAGVPSVSSSASSSVSANASTPGAAPRRSATPNDGRIKKVRMAIVKASREGASSGVLRNLTERLRRLEEDNIRPRGPRKKAHQAREKKRDDARHGRQAQKGQQRKRSEQKRRKKKVQKKLKKAVRSGRQRNRRRGPRGGGGDSASGGRSSGGADGRRRDGRGRGRRGGGGGGGNT